MNIPQMNDLEILDRITDGFFSLDSNWNFTYINKEAARLLFRNKEELMGKHIWSEFPEAVHLMFYEQYHKALSEQVPVAFDAYFPPLDAWFEVRAYPSFNGLTVFFQDVTEKKKAVSQHEQHYKSLFEHNPDAVFSFDLNGNYLSVNSAMQRLLGYSEEEMLQLSFIPIVDKEDLEKTMDHYKKAASGTTQNYETKILHKDGRTIHVSVTNIPIIVDGQIVGVYGIAKDITKQKKTEEILVRSEKLSAVGQLSASIAHEIRNPLTSLKGFLQLIKSSLTDISSDYFNIMSDEITRIEMITGELLLLAKPQAHYFKFENIKETIEEVALLLGSQSLMNKVEIAIDCKELPLINCVKNQLKQAFINIIKNAIESMPGGGKIEITVRKHNDDKVFIRISDQGCGIPQELLTKIGLPFYTTKEKGTGLGMMTTFKIIESHGGTMEISSEVGKGTTVSIYLPINSLD
ncbi:MAG: PAS domain S-box protein [Ectobacillus sp.]